MSKIYAKCNIFPFLVTGLPVSLQKVYLNNDLSTIEKSDTLLDIGRCFTSIARIALNGSAYVTVSMAIERLIGKGYESLRFMIIIFLQRNMLKPADNHLFFSIGIAFPMASLSWPKRRLYMYMIPVAIISISANIPEIHSVMGHFLGFKVTFDK